MMYSTLLGLVALPSALSFPWVANLPGVNNDKLNMLGKRQGNTEAGCPKNPNHPGAAPFDPRFPYLGARSGLPATHPVGNIEVPHDDDRAHDYEAPGPLDIRGPCPGLNTAANHHFISHDGITNLAEMMDAQQNIWNVGYDLGLTLATIGIALTGDPITKKMSIGCDATSRTALLGSLLGEELGIDAHNKFEADTSLSRSDFFLQEPDDYTFNATLFAAMTKTTGANYNLPNMVTFMGQRYEQSKADNANFYFGPKVVLLYGAASFLFRLFPNFVNGNTAPPNLQNIGPFFGAKQTNTGTTDPKFQFINERIPDEWHNRLTPLTLANVADDFVTMYSSNPVLLGGNVGKNNFDLLGTSGNGLSGIVNSKFGTNPKDFICLLYQIATDNVPSSLGTTLSKLANQVVTFARANLDGLPVFANAGCPLPLA